MFAYLKNLSCSKINYGKQKFSWYHYSLKYTIEEVLKKWKWMKIFKSFFTPCPNIKNSLFIFLNNETESFVFPFSAWWSNSTIPNFMRSAKNIFFFKVETYSEPCQTSKMELFTNRFMGFGLNIPRTNFS